MTTTEADVTILDELARLNKAVNDCEQTLRAMDRCQARGYGPMPLQRKELQDKLEQAIKERDWMESALSRYMKRPLGENHAKG